ncbi:expressed unknown protein [Seminavis robusta]|uniref:Uncharacterized protein n=1 Tax=Seminavis robusta TaxID=568900 RepID=A0A9N8EKA1_9STRA|nr:expressed unknown protein [Seminavis robusta]|eukprot:Sro1348_g265020.1 n/a (933) ;mRNA; r:15306-18104
MEDSIDLSHELEEGSDGNDPEQPTDEEKQSNASNKAEKESKRKKRVMLMTILHFLLAFPKWSMTLFVYFASLSLPLAATNVAEVVQVPILNLKTFLEQESLAYHQCTLDAFDNLNKEILLVADEEYQNNVLGLHKHNQALLREIRTVTQSCNVAGVKGREALHGWSVLDGQDLPYLNHTCSASDQDYIAKSLGQDFQQLENEIGSIVGGYAETSNSTVGHIRAYAEERTDYDYTYFVKERIEPALEVLRQLASNPLFPSVEFTIQAQQVVDELVKLLQEGFNEAYRIALIRIQVLQERVEHFYESIEQFLRAYNYLYERFKNVTLLVQRWAPSLDEIPDFATLHGLRIGEHFLPDIFEIPEFLTDLPDLELLLQNFTNQAVPLIQDLLDKLEEEANNALEYARDEILAQLRKYINLEDYNPPQYQGSRPEISTLEEEEAFLSKAAESAKAGALLAVQKIKGLTNLSAGGLPTRFPELEMGNFTFIDNATTFDYQEPELPDIGIPDWIMYLFAKLLSWKFGIDLTVQFLRGFMLKAKYERLTEPQKQVIDKTRAKEGDENQQEDNDDDGDDEGGGSSTCGCNVSGYLYTIWSTAMNIGRNLVSIWMVGFLVMLPIAIFGMVYYLPHVHQSCLETDEGTFTASIFTPLILNHASAPGNALHIKGEFDCRQRQRLLCDKMFADSDLLHRSNVLELSNLQQQYNQSQGWNMRLDRCIDTDVLDQRFEEACCGLEGYGTNSNCSLEPALRNFRCPIDERAEPPAAFYTMSSYVFDPNCKVDSTGWILQDARFDCQVLENSCSRTPCTGVNEELISVMAAEADCLVHLVSLRAIAFASLVVFHAFMINVHLTLLFNGAKGLSWRFLAKRDAAFEVVVAADKNGTMKQMDKMNTEVDAAKIERRTSWNGLFQFLAGTVFVLFHIVSAFAIHDILDPLKS